MVKRKFGIRSRNQDKELTVINIDKIYEQNLFQRHLYDTSFHRKRYAFPTIDFKFKNTSTTTAFLWKFAINVLHVEIDQTPILDFTTYWL